MAIAPRIDLETRYKKIFNEKSGVVGTQFTKNQFGKDISGMEGGPGNSGQPFIKRFPIIYFRFYLVLILFKFYFDY